MTTKGLPVIPSPMAQRHLLEFTKEIRSQFCFVGFISTRASAVKSKQLSTSKDLARDSAQNSTTRDPIVHESVHELSFSLSLPSVFLLHLHKSQIQVYKPYYYYRNKYFASWKLNASFQSTFFAPLFCL